MRIQAILSIIIAFVAAPVPSKCQTPLVKLTFEVNGQAQPDRGYQVIIDIDGRSFEPRIVKGGFTVPVEVRDAKRIQVRFVSGKYDLIFREMTTAHFDSEWVIGVKNPPFKEDPDGPLVSEDGKHLQLIYYIEFRPHNAEGTTWVTRVYN